MIPVQYIMTRYIFKIQEEASVLVAVRMMKDYKVGSLLVTRNGEYVGIFTETDLTRRVVAEGLAPSTTAVGSVMSFPVVTIEGGESLLEAYNLMDEKGIRHLAVTAEGRIVGVISIRDLIHPIYLGKESWVGGRST